METTANRFPNLSPLKQALLALEELQRKLEQSERWRTEPIAVIGMGCRFPQAADPAQYWDLLRKGGDAVTEVPASRWAIEDYYDANPDAPGKMSTRWGGFIDDVDLFDPEFFGISPREAVNIDPQQRLLLEVVWEALENAGQGPCDLLNHRTGVFVGITSDEYAQEFHRVGDLAVFNAYFASGIARSVAGGRISYTLGLQGPNLSIDTACSSSLVAVHTACLYLRMGECRMALAGGSNVILAPEISIAYSKSHMMAADGHCKAFDSRADGFVRGEGCGIVVLKRLGDALADGDRILGLIRGSAINQDGRSSGLTVPSLAAQQAVIRQALASGGIKPDEIGYIEAHGTGTALGDPIEARALAAVLGRGRTNDNPLVVGSVKANLGHLESAAGVAGLIKTILALENEQIPRQLHFHKMNPHVDWGGMPVEIPVKARSWPGGGPKRLAGVSSFGFSGTNAHVIVEEAPVRERPKPEVERPLHILTVSARSETALSALVGRFAEMLEQTPEDPGDICFTANAGRAQFDYRLSVTADSREQMRTGLLEALSGERVRDGDGIRAAFLFPGQGAQYPGMGKELYDTQPEFRRTLDECAELLKGELEEPLLEVLWGGRTGLIDETRYTQPALFAVEYAVAQLWRSWGIEPAVVLGHSVGEYVAACVAGVYSLADGLKLIARRGRLMQAVGGRGAMAAVMAPEPRVREALEGLETQVRIAALNAAESVVISGYAEGVEIAEERLRGGGARVQRLTVSHGFHSPQMAEMEGAWEQVVGTVRFEAPKVELISSVTGKRVAAGEMAEAGYWRRQVSEPVRFRAGMETLEAQGCRVYLEAGPGTTLTGLARQTITDGEALWVTSLGKGRGEWRQMLDSLGRLWTRGAEVDWTAFDKPYRRQRVALPTYPFERQRYWIEKRERKAEPPVSPGVHPLLGSRIEIAADAGTSVWQTRIGVERLPYLGDHGAFGSLIFPLTGYLEMMTAALAGPGVSPGSLLDVAVYEPLVFTREEQKDVQLTLRGDALEIHSKQGENWRRHVTARRGAASPVAPSEPASKLAERMERQLDVADFYRMIADRGMNFGPAFRAIREIHCCAGESLANVINAEPAGPYGIHPAVLDGCFQALAAALPAGSEDLYLPVGMERFDSYKRAGSSLWAHAALRSREPGGANLLKFDIQIFDETGAVSRVSGLEMRRVESSGKLRSARRREGALFELRWEPMKNVAGPIKMAAGWLIVADRGGVGVALARELTTLGGRCTVVNEQAAIRAVVSSGAWHGVIYLCGLDADSLAAGDLQTPSDCQTAVCGGALELVQALAAQPGETPPRLWLVTRAAQMVWPEQAKVAVAQSTLWGLAQAIAEEHPEWRTVCIDLDPAGGNDAAGLIGEIRAGDGEQQVAYRGGERLVARLVPRHLPEGLEQPLRLAISSRGVLDNLKTEPAVRRPVPPGSVEIQVDATALNFRDVLNVLGMYPGDPGPLGSECAGHVVAVGEGVEDWRAGDDVIAMAPGGHDGFVIADARLVALRPANLTAVQAATIPTAFLTARYTLEFLARIKPGDRVLIHAATGGVGLAAVRIAQRNGAEIFTTAGSERKRAYLRSLGVPHVMSSRNVDFTGSILRQTEGRGVDVVLNSLTGEFIPATFSVLSENGRFLEIGKRNIWTARQVAELGRNIAYHVVDLGETSVSDPETLGRLLRDTAAAIERLEFETLPARVYSFQDAAAAYRWMAQAQHIGKVVLRQSADGARISPNATYLVTGAFGSLGVRVVEWLLEQGARTLALIGRNGPSLHSNAALELAATRGARIVIYAADVSRRDEMERILSEIAASLPPLRGVLHTAGVLDDGVLTQQNWKRFESVMAPKVGGAWNLHCGTASLPLDFFVLFSSVASVLGAPGQGNYAAANAFQDSLAHERRRLGLPAVSINWGAWVAGMASREDLERRRREIGLPSMPIEEGLVLLNQVMLDSPAQVVAGRFDWGRFVSRYPAGTVPKRFTGLAGASQGAADQHNNGQPSLLERLTAAPEAHRAGILMNCVHGIAVRVLGLAANRQIDPERPLNDMGLDSLMAVEFRNALAAQVGQSLPATLLFSYPALEDLSGYLMVLLFGGAQATEPANGRQDALGAIEELSEEEVDRMLAEKLRGTS